MEFFDSHAHYNDEQFKQDQEQILKQVYEDKITKLVCAGYNLQSSIQATKIATNHDFVYATVGISPNDIPEKDFKQNFPVQLQEIETLVKNSPKGKNKKIVAIGEIGLDYHWNQENKQEQKEAFIQQIELANRLNLPIVIHTREAVNDTIDILKNQIQPLKKGIFHYCPLNLELIKEGLKLGMLISFAGPITFKNSKNAQEAILQVPLENMLIETDSPYLAPEPKRGTRNNSANVKYIAQKIAQVKKIEIEKVAKATYENANRIFEI